jgi:hypothetical protein
MADHDDVIWRGLAEDLQRHPRFQPTRINRVDQVTFTDSQGVLWIVKEDGADDARPATSDIAPGTTWLRFENDLEVRRLWHYPDDWRGLSPIQLESLLERASTVIARFRPAMHRPIDRDDSLGRTNNAPENLAVRPAAPNPRPPRSRGDSGDE